MSRPVKRSITLSGHRTSIALEPEFWAALEAIAQDRGLSLVRLVSEIDAARLAEAGTAEPASLSSALRVFALKHSPSR